MNETASSGTERPEYQPEGKVAGSLDPEAVEATVEELEEAGFGAEAIEILTADDFAGVETPFEETGLKGLVDRFVLSIGDDLARLEMARKELAAGRVLITVQVDEGAEQEAIRQVSDILHKHGSRLNFYTSRWKVTLL